MSRARDLSKLISPSSFTVDTNNNIGVNSTSPDAKLDVIGIVSATSFFGDGAGLTGVAATFTGVLTYEDVTNIDSVGIVTARTGIKVLAGGINAVGVVTATGVNATGIVTAASFVGSGQNLTNLPASGDSNDITACLFI